jgi:ATP-dependent Lhr-like helicase
MQRRAADHRSGMLITTINGTPVAQHWMARPLQDAGFQPAPIGFNLRRVLMPVTPLGEAQSSEPQPSEVQ